MLIITLDDQDFPAVLDAWKGGTAVGKYWRNGKVQIVCATRQFMLVSEQENPNKIAMRPARNFGEAETLALRLLDREKERGNEVELGEKYTELTQKDQS